VAFEDNPTLYDAWEIEDYYKLKAYEWNEPADTTPVVDGTRAGLAIRRTYMHSTIEQTIWLYSEGRRIDVETNIDWQESHQLLKAVFPLDIRATAATYDIQFGHVSRPTHRNTSWDQAKFETYAHKWVDVSEDGYGVALLNNGKYGHSAEGSTLSLTLLKSATYPNPEADRGMHQFTYSLLPHTEDFRRGGVIEESHALNQPLYERTVLRQEGDLPARYSFVSADRPSVVFTAIKQAEDRSGVILRFHDAYNRRDTVTLTVPHAFSKAILCDLMENPLEELELRDHRVTLPVGNFEVVTVKLVK
jgi:alpha-mannosidase